jgi:hypothetical protein
MKAYGTLPQVEPHRGTAGIPGWLSIAPDESNDTPNGACRNRQEPGMYKVMTGVTDDVPQSSPPLTGGRMPEAWA